MTSMQTSRSSANSMIRAGALAAIVAALGNVVVLLLSQNLLGMIVQVSAQPGSSQLIPLSLGAVIGASVIPAIGATLLLALLDRFVARPVRIFQIIGVLFLLVSFAPVLSVPVDAGMKVVLGVMHIVAGGAIIGILSRAAQP